MRIVRLIGAALLLGAGMTAAAAESDMLYLRTTMKEAVNPAIFGIWDITNNAMSDDGGIDPKLMNDAKWQTVQARALDLANRYAPERVSNLMSVGGTQQVMLKVRFAEMQRSVSKSLSSSLAVQGGVDVGVVGETGGVVGDTEVGRE